MDKLTTSDLTSLQNETAAISTINANFALVETAIEKTLSRDGTSPNTMSANLDMNSNRVTNLPLPVSATEAASKTYVDTLVGSLNEEYLLQAINAAPAALASQAAALASQTAAAASAIEAAAYVGSAVSAQRWSTPQVITFSGDSSSVSPTWDGSAGLAFPLTISNDAITNAKIADMAGDRIKGRLSSSGDPQDLTGTQVNSILPVVSSANGLAPGFGGGDANKFLRGTGAWSAVPANSLDMSASTIGTSSIIRIGNSGFKIMGGRTITASSDTTIVFPEAFTTGVYNIQVTVEGTGSGEGGVYQATVKNGGTTLSQFGVYTSWENPSPDTFQPAAGVTFYWQAWGV